LVDSDKFGIEIRTADVINSANFCDYQLGVSVWRRRTFGFSILSSPSLHAVQAALGLTSTMFHLLQLLAHCSLLGDTRLTAASFKLLRYLVYRVGQKPCIYSLAAATYS